MNWIDEGYNGKYRLRQIPKTSTGAEELEARAKMLGAQANMKQAKGSAGAGYMQGIAAIGNALNDTHRNVLGTIDYFRGGGAGEEAQSYRNQMDQTRKQNQLSERQANMGALGLMGAGKNNLRIFGKKLLGGM